MSTTVALRIGFSAAIWVLVTSLLPFARCRHSIASQGNRYKIKGLHSK